MNAADWTGPIGDVWAAEWRRTDRTFADLAPHLNAAILAVALAGPCRVFDIGCGAGATSIGVAVAHAEATVTGVDLSPALVAVARDRSNLPNLAFETGDAVEAAAACAPDIYVSRHGVMFFDDPVAAFTRLAAAAAPGAALIFSCFTSRAANRWAADTVAAIDGSDGATPAPTTPGPFAFADPDHVAAILTAAGWRAGPPDRIVFSYRAGEGEDAAAAVADAVDFFRRIGPPASLLRAMPDADRPAALARLATVCERNVIGTAVDFPAEAWIWSAYLPTERNAS